METHETGSSRAFGSFTIVTENNTWTGSSRTPEHIGQISSWSTSPWNRVKSNPIVRVPQSSVTGEYNRTRPTPQLVVTQFVRPDFIRSRFYPKPTTPYQSDPQARIKVFVGPRQSCIRFPASLRSNVTDKSTSFQKLFYRFVLQTRISAELERESIYDMNTYTT